MTTGGLKAHFVTYGRSVEQTDVEIVQHWTSVSGIPYLGRADIGHDAANKIVPFGATRIA